MLVLRWSERAHCFFCGRPIGYIRALKGHSALWKRPGDNLVSKAFHDSNFYFSWKLALVTWAKGSSIKTLKGSWPSCLFISELTLVSALQPVNAFPTWNSLHQVKWSCQLLPLACKTSRNGELLQVFKVVQWYCGQHWGCLSLCLLEITDLLNSTLLNSTQCWLKYPA